MLKVVRRYLRPLKRIWFRGIRLIHPNLHDPDISISYRIYGSGYCGWPIVDGSVGPNSVVYSFGIGDDISFDLSIIAKFGCQVHGFDPTPRCNAWIKKQNLPSQFRFYPIGIADKDGDTVFFAPHKKEHVSFSKAPSKEAGSTVTAKVMRLSSIMTLLHHTRVDVLKMDIEGFEYDVLRDFLSSSLRPSQVLLEFHHGKYLVSETDTLTAVEALRAKGYRLFYVSEFGREYGFLYSGTASSEMVVLPPLQPSQ